MDYKRSPANATHEVVNPETRSLILKTQLLILKARSLVQYYPYTSTTV